MLAFMNRFQICRVMALVLLSTTSCFVDKESEDQMKYEIRNALSLELLSSLSAQTCEDTVIPDVNTHGRADMITEKIKCIEKSLNSWKGVHFGQQTAVTAGTQLNRVQITRMVRTLESLQRDYDVTKEQNESIKKICDDFAHFNFL